MPPPSSESEIASSVGDKKESYDSEYYSESEEQSQSEEEKLDIPRYA